MSNLQSIQAAVAKLGEPAEVVDYDGVPLALHLDRDGELEVVTIAGFVVNDVLDQKLMDRLTQRVLDKRDDYRTAARMQFRIEQAESRRPF